ncbi:Integration host factor beta subunit [Sideroxydans sp. CL21]|nr:Integration host factor beta subunit [Sideroxydans sp. CL21]
MSVRLILDQISCVLEKKERVEIRGFGTFGILHRLPRNGRNPKTGLIVEVPAKDVPHFKAGIATRSRVQKLFLLQMKKPSVSPDESRGLNKERP